MIRRSKKKIIQILCHTLASGKKLRYHVRGNWAARQARTILAYSKKYDCEVWYAVRGLRKASTFIADEITYRLFPAKTLNALFESFTPIISCPGILDALQQEDPENAVIHIQGERGSLLHAILRTFPLYKITLQYHGYGQPPAFDWLENLFLAPAERKLFPRISHFFVHIKRRIDYLKKVAHIPMSKISFQNNGIDFDRFRPGSRASARKKLSIPADAFVILYVGVMTQTKGVDKIIEATNILRAKYPHVFLVLVGAAKTDPLYEKSKRESDKLVHLVDNSLLPNYYQAANVYVFYGTKKTIEYAGVGTAPTEALATNTNDFSPSPTGVPGCEIINIPAGAMKEIVSPNFNPVIYVVPMPCGAISMRSSMA